MEISVVISKHRCNQSPGHSGASSTLAGARNVRSVLPLGMQQIKLRRLPASHQFCSYGSQGPGHSVPGLINTLLECQPSRKIFQTLGCDVFSALNTVRAETKLPIEGSSLFLQHLLSTLFLPIEWRVADNQMPTPSQPSQRFLESASIIDRVMMPRVHHPHHHLLSPHPHT